MKKQLEEMANIIKTVKYAPFNYGEPTYTVGVQMADFVFDLIAKALYEAGYTRKVNDDEVVISKEEYEKLQKHYLFMQDYTVVEVLERECKHTQKEMIGEILQKLYNERCSYLGFYSELPEEAVNVRDIIKLAEKLGVKVK